MNPSAADILEAIDAVPTEDVLVLPNNSNVVLTAEQAAALERQERACRSLDARSRRGWPRSPGSCRPANSAGR